MPEGQSVANSARRVVASAFDRIAVWYTAVPPAAGTRAVTITSGLLTLSDGGLAAPVSFPLTLSTANKVTFSANTNKVSLTLSPTTGVVKGLFTPPGSTVAKPFSGVIRQDTGTMLGGFLARKGDGEPGVKTIWQGLQRVMDFAAGIRFARAVGHH